MLKWTITNIFETNGKKYAKQKTKIKQKNQMEILEPNMTITKIKA